MTEQCIQCDGTGKVDSGAPDPQGHFIQIPCECRVEYAMTCSVAEWHQMHRKERDALIDLEITKCKEENSGHK